MTGSNESSYLSMAARESSVLFMGHYRLYNGATCRVLRSFMDETAGFVLFCFVGTRNCSSAD